MHKYQVNFSPLMDGEKRGKEFASISQRRCHGLVPVLRKWLIENTSDAIIPINTQGESSLKEITFWFISTWLAYATHTS